MEEVQVMNRFHALAWLTAGTAVLNAIEFISARASAYLQRRDEAPPTPQPEPQTMPVPTPVTLPPVPEEATAGYWWQRLFTLDGLFGLVAGLCEGPILIVNSYLIAATLETILDRPGNPIIPVILFGWEREITDFDLIGALISVAQMLAASALHLAWEARQRLWTVFGLALVALLSLVFFETGATVYRSFRIDVEPWNAVMSGAQALGIASVECIVGIFAIDRCLLPCSLAVLWSLATPIRAMGRWWRKRQGTRVLRVRPRRQRRSHPMLLALAYPLAALDHAVMAPLRRLDRAVSALLPGKWRRHKGEKHVEAYVPPPSADSHRARNGHEPDRVPVDQHEHLQTEHRVDHGLGHHPISP